MKRFSVIVVIGVALSMLVLGCKKKESQPVPGVSQAPSMSTLWVQAVLVQRLKKLL